VIGQTVHMDREGRQELHYRAIEGDISGIRDRLAAGDDVTLADRQGFTALHFAAQQSQADAVRTLLEAGAPVDPQDRYGNTPLWRAVFDSRGRGETIQALLAGGANPDLPNAQGVSPRDLADRIANFDVIAFMPPRT
jgi:uncharacterized protein